MRVITLGAALAASTFVFAASAQAGDSSWRWETRTGVCYCVTQGNNLCSLFHDSSGIPMILVRNGGNCSARNPKGYLQVKATPLNQGKFKTNHRGICDIATRRCSGTRVSGM